MKTIAITVDQETLALIDELQSSSAQFQSRSALVRAAIREYSRSLRRRLEEDRERGIVQQNKDLLDKQLKALVEEQAQ
jgi:Arc/MetJ-type ribon-helix-helix transcriptional regulator